MKSIIVISENDHGIIRFAKEIVSTVSYLIIYGWITEDTTFFYEEWGEEFTLNDYFGNEWKAEILNMSLSLEDFNKFFDDRFLLTEEKVFSI